MTVKRMLVNMSGLAIGSVALWGAMALADGDANKGPAGGAASAPQAGHLIGIVTDLGWPNDKPMTVTPDDPNGKMIFQHPDNKALAAIWQTISVDHTVEVKYTMVDGQPVVTGIKLLSPVSGKGTATGIVTDKQSDGKKIYVAVKSGNTPTLRYTPLWDRSANATTKSSVDAIAAANIGDKVEVAWFADGERVHMTALKVVAKAKPTSKPAAGQ